jgi:ubiquinone biosynthesis accessory factor UbiK
MVRHALRKNNKCTPSGHRVRVHWTGLVGLVYGEAMLDPKFFDDLARRLSNALPAGAKEIQQDVEKNLRAVLQASLSRLDLVTREEFDVQARVLARTREKLDKLEKTVTALERQSNGSEDNPHADQTRQ